MLQRLLFLCLGILGMQLASAQSLLLKNAPETIYFNASDPTLAVGLEVVNLSESTVRIKAARTINGITDGQDSYFCWSLCYGSDTDTSVNELFLSAGDSTDNFQLYFSPNNIGTAADITFVFYRSDKPEDKVSHTFKFRLYGTTALDPEHHADKLLSLPYPNPSRGVANMHYALPKPGVEAQFRVFNLIGREVFRQSLRQNTGAIRLQTHSWAPGMYMLYLDIEGKTVVTRRLVVIR